MEVDGFNGDGLFFYDQAKKIGRFVHQIAADNEQIVSSIKTSSLRDEWAEFSPGERKKKANIFYDNAYKAANKADEAYINFLNDSLKSYPEDWQRYLTVSEARERARDEAGKARAAWSETAEVLKLGFSLAVENFKNWWVSRINVAEREKLNWANALLSYELPRKEGSYEPSEKDLQQFHYATIVDYSLPEDFEGAKPGQKKQTKILKTMFNPSYVFIEEVVDDVGFVIKKEMMGADHLLVTLQEGADPVEFCKELKSQVRSSLVTSIERVISDESLYELGFKLPSLLRSTSVELLAEVLKISKSLAVRSNYNFIYQMDTVPNDPIYRPSPRPHPDYNFGQWNLHTSTGGIKAVEAWGIRHSAESIVVAVIDSGMKHDHEDFIHQDNTSNLWNDLESIVEDGDELNHGWNYAIEGEGNNDIMDRCKNVHADGKKVYGHGTPIAGIIGAAGNNERGIAGIAWKIQIMTCKVTETTSLVAKKAIRGIRYACDQGARILNCSFSFKEHDKDMLAALKYAQEKGVIIVASAGNEGVNKEEEEGFSYPFDYELDNIVIVASSQVAGDLSPHSSYGKSTVHQAAPGLGIWSTTNDDETLYDQFNGSSFAVPHVTGALALMMEHFPERTYQEQITHLLETTDKIPSLRDKVISGGRLNLFRALGGNDPSPVVKKILGSKEEDSEILFRYYGTDLGSKFDESYAAESKASEAKTAAPTAPVSNSSSKKKSNGKSKKCVIS